MVAILDGIGTILGTLCIVIVIIYMSYVCSKYIGKGAVKRNHSQYIKLVDRIVVGQDKSIAIVQIGNRSFLIGIVSSQMSLLAELNPDDLVVQDYTDKSQSDILDFKDLMLKIISRKNDKQ